MLLLMFAVFHHRDDVSNTNIGEGYINYQPDPYDDGFDSWQNTQSPAMNDGSMTNDYGNGLYTNQQRY